MNINYKLIGRRIGEVRRFNGMTQEGLAKGGMTQEDGSDTDKGPDKNVRKGQGDHRPEPFR